MTKTDTKGSNFSFDEALKSLQAGQPLSGLASVKWRVLPVA